jgi:hypothetical protein
MMGRSRMIGPLWGRDSRGHSFAYFERPVPPIPEQLLQSVVYLYPSIGAAQAGEKAGGTGFLVEWQQPDSDLQFVCAVSNSHVVWGRSDAPVVRLNTVDGATAVLPLIARSWIPHPSGDDVAVAPIGLSPEHHRFACVKRESFIWEESIGAFRPGVDAFFLGRFMAYEGIQQNQPTVRFGNLAMSPPQPVKSSESGISQESFLVEARSLPGYSGSPVFIFSWSGGEIAASVGVGLIHLLGIDWCHLRDWVPVKHKKTGEEADDLVAQQHSGMMGVVPAWKLTELLDSQEVLDMATRVQGEHRRDTDHVALDAATKEDEFERFEDLARKLVQIPKKELDEKREGRK